MNDVKLGPLRDERHRWIPDDTVDEPRVSRVHAGNVTGLATLPISFTPSSREAAQGH